MGRRSERAVKIGAVLCCVCGAVVLAAYGLRDSVTYFRSPTEIVERSLSKPGYRVRVGGLVADGSVEVGGDGWTYFSVTDGRRAIRVRTGSILPDLFAEGEGVVAEGVFEESGVFRATRVLARHDENYMPSEVYEALRRASRSSAGGIIGDGVVGDMGR